MEVETFQPLFYALDVNIVAFAVILWILLHKSVKCNHLLNISLMILAGLTYEDKMLFNILKMIDIKLSIVIDKSCEKLTHTIFHQGKLPVRAGRKATGLKAWSGGYTVVTFLNALVSSKPGCRGGNNPSGKVIIILEARLFNYNPVKSISETLKVIGASNLLSNSNPIIAMQGGVS